MAQNRKVLIQAAIVIGGVVFLAWRFLGPAILRTPSARPMVAARPGLSEAVVSVTADAIPRPPEPSTDGSKSPEGEAGYTARELRDPLQSLLPLAPKTPTATAPAPTIATEPPSLPVEPPETSAPATPSLVVQGVVWGGPKPQAIINEQLYEVGDMVGSSTIVAIDRRGVVIEHRGTEMVFEPSPVAMSQESYRASGGLQQSQSWR